MVPEVTIMNARKFKGQKILAMAVVAMFAFCAFSVCLNGHESDAADSDDGYSYNDMYNLHLVSKGNFTYSPTFNMNTGKIQLALTGNSGGSLSNTEKQDANTFNSTLTVNCVNDAVNPITKTATLTATWTGGVNNNLTQTAVQELVFHIYKDITIDKDLSKTSAVSGPTKANADLATITVNGPEEANKSATTTTTLFGIFKKYDDSTKTYVDCADAPFNIVADGMGAKLVASKDLTTADAGEYEFTVKASFDNGSYQDEATETFRFMVYKTLEIEVTPVEIDVYVGQDKKETASFEAPKFVFSITDNTQGATAEYTIANSSTIFGTSGITGEVSATTNTTSTYTVDISGANQKLIFPDNNKSSGDYVTYNITASATIKYPNNETSTPENAVAHLNVYKSFAFTQKPVVENSQSYAASGNPLDVLISADFTGTSKISYNWGDGKSTVIETNPDSGSKYSARHVYANSGTYLITITAYNSTGSTTLYSLYDADTSFFEEVPAEGEDTNPDNKDDTPAKESFFDKHGYQFIIFAVIAILAFVAFFFFGIQNPVVLIAGIITALLAVLCFVYNDIGGLIEELKALLKL